MANTGRLLRLVVPAGFIILSTTFFVLLYIIATWPASSTLDFQTAYGVGSLHFVHAALWTGDSIRISAIKPRGTSTAIWCHIWYSSNQTSNATVVPAIVKDLDSYGEEITVASIKCPLKNTTDSDKVAPVAVGLANTGLFWTENVVSLPVQNRDMDPSMIHRLKNESTSKASNLQQNQSKIVEFTVCIPPLFVFDNAAQLVEKLEMVKILGASRVVFFIYRIAPNVHSVLQFYVKEWAEGRETLQVILHSWTIPRIEIHYFGQIAAIDNCLYRYGWLSRYMVFDDLDEFMIPLRHDTWSQLIAEREKLNPGHAAFMFRSSYMDKDHTSVAKGYETDAFRYGSSILSFTKRDKHIWPSNQKSKLIVNPRRVESLAVHHVSEGHGPTDIIPVNQGILYHYRWPIADCKPEVEDSRVVNKFGKRLLARIKVVWSKLDGVHMGWGQNNIDSGTYNCHANNKGEVVHCDSLLALILVGIIQLAKLLKIHS